MTRRFREVGLDPDTRQGQNFLIDMNLQRLLLETAGLEPRDVVLEIGTGTGGLTAQMAPRVAAVVTVEIDRRLFQMASEELIDCDNVTMLRQDVLKNKNRFHPAVLEAVAQQLAAGPDRRFKLLANLPYKIATPVVSNLLACKIVPYSMTVTIQNELADRITARPSTKDYGALSVWVQSQCRPRIVRVMPPSVFWPRPKVHSAIIHVQTDEKLRSRIPDIGFFHVFARSMFFHRRKFLRSVIASAYKRQIEKPQIDRIMAEMGLAADCRAEQLDVAAMLGLCEKIRATLSDGQENPQPQDPQS